MPFDYYKNLNAKQRKTYRESDKIVHVDLGEVSQFQPALTALRDGLKADDRRQVQRACAALAHGITDALGIGRVRVRMGGRRPVEADGGELFGQCSWDEEETKGALVELWMRTAKRGQAVAFKTLLRTLFHELCHHLDYELHGLDNTFHTEGFFRRESSLFRQLVQEATTDAQSVSSPARTPSTSSPPPPSPSSPRKRGSRVRPTSEILDSRLRGNDDASSEAAPEPESTGQLDLPF